MHFLGKNQSDLIDAENGVGEGLTLHFIPWWRNSMLKFSGLLDSLT